MKEKSLLRIFAYFDENVYTFLRYTIEGVFSLLINLILLYQSLGIEFYFNIYVHLILFIFFFENCYLFLRILCYTVKKNFVFFIEYNKHLRSKTFKSNKSYF